MKKLAVVMTGVALAFAGCGEEPIPVAPETEQWERELDETIEYYENDAKKQEEAFMQQMREDEQKIQDGMSELELLDEQIKEGR
jgi:hypothetical protein